MDHSTSEDSDLLTDLESGRINSEEGTSRSIVSGNRQAKNLLHSVASGLLGYNGSAGVEYRGNPYSNSGEPSEIAAENVELVISNYSGEGTEEHLALVEKKHMKEKHRKTNYKKAPKPPRPPKGPSLDAGDMKLVKEISTIAMKKRARTERLKALKKMKGTKSSSSPPSSSLSSGSSLSAMVITVLFFLVIVYQGFCSRSSSSVSFHGSPEPALATKSLISVQFYNNPFANDSSGPGS